VNDFTMDLGLGDLDNDGDLDVVAINDSSAAGDVHTIYFNAGNGTFPVSSAYPAPPGYYLTLGDLDGDADLDLVLDKMLGLNNGDGTFSSGTSVGADTTSDVALGDMDGDGDLDWIQLTRRLENNRVVYEGRIYPNNGNATFGQPHTFGGTTPFSVLALGDLNGDSDLDMVTGNDNLEQTGEIFINQNE
jgi:hypothetical protein